MFMPIFLPILLAGFVIEWPYPLLVGVLGPLVSALITGMPPIFPIAPIMSAEGLAAAATASYLFQIRHRGPWLSVLIALIAERLTLALIVFFLMPFLGIASDAISLIAIIYSFAGVILLLVLIPFLVETLRHSGIIIHQ